MAWRGAWPPFEISESRRRLADLVTVLDELPPNSPSEIEPAVARFVVVRACGHIEFVLDESVSAYARAVASPQVAAFVRHQLFRGRNPTPERLRLILGQLDEGRAQRFDEFLRADDERVKRELAYLVDRRNKIAHGQSESVNRRKALDLASVAIAVGDWLVHDLSPIR